MKILGIDTSSPIGSVALLDNDLVVSESLLDSSRAYSDKLLKEVEQIILIRDNFTALHAEVLV